MRLIAAAATAALLVGTSVQSARAEPAIADILSCAHAGDQPICLLRAAAKLDGGAAIFSDFDLPDHPELMALAGLSAADAMRWRESDAGRQHARIAELAGDRKAVAEAVRRDRAGAPAAEALAPLMALSGEPIPVPRLFGVPALPPPRDVAFADLLQTAPNQPRGVSPALRRAALEAWTADVDRLGEVAAAAQLAHAWQRAGETARAHQVLSRVSDSSTRADVLMAMGETKAALDLAAASGSVELQMRLIHDARTAGFTAEARPLADHLLTAKLAPMDEASLRSLAEDLAAVATPQIATDWVERQDREIAVDVAPIVLEADVLGVAGAWRSLHRQDRIDALISRLRPYAQAEVEARKVGSRRAELDRGVARALGRLLVGEGRAEEASRLGLVTPADLLVDDMQRGRGTANLARYNAESPAPGRLTLAAVCVGSALVNHAYEAELPCFEDWRQQADSPRARIMVASAALREAGNAANLERLPLARALLALAADTASETTLAGKGTETPSLTTSISDASAAVRIATAELRADGRLPKLASPPPPSPRQTMVSPAP